MVIAGCMMLSLHTFASGKITKLTVTAGIVEVWFDTTVGERYQLQCRSSLESDNWVNIGASFKADAAVSIRTADASGSNCFFRVVKTTTAASPPPPPSPPPPLPTGI